MPPVAGRIVQRLRVVCDSLVPHQHRAGLVADAALKVLPLGNVVKEELEEVVRLLLVESHDALGVHGIHDCIFVKRVSKNTF